MKDKNPLILWVDDDFSLRILAERVLMKAGYDCVTAGSGEEALAILKKLKPELIILDVEMPGMNGFETCIAIRKYTSSYKIPVLTVTCHDDFDSIAYAYDAGATDFMTKPLNWKLLVYRIQYMLRSDRVLNNLMQCKSRLRNVQTIAQLGTWEWNNKTGQIYISPEVCQLFGWPDQQVITCQQFLDSFHPDDKEDFVNLIKSVGDAKQFQFTPFKIAHRIIHTDGKERYVVHHGEVACNGTCQPDWVTGAVQTIGVDQWNKQQLESERESA
ncbi:MAG TPA: response regulator [Crenotrichaceae bacterium]|nr:response regulator [Crenotrichaceae bacterium]